MPPLKRGGVGFSSSDPHGVFDRVDENLAVADLAGLGGIDNRPDDFLGLIGRNRHLKLQFRKEADGIFGAAVDLGVALLAPESLHLGDGHAVNANGGESVTHFLQLERLDNRHDNFHVFYPLKWPRDGLGGRYWILPNRGVGHRQSSRVPIAVAGVGALLAFLVAYADQPLPRDDRDHAAVTGEKMTTCEAEATGRDRTIPYKKQPIIDSNRPVKPDRMVDAGDLHVEIENASAVGKKYSVE